MNENIEKENVLRLHQFVLNNKSEDIRKELYEYMIVRAIYEHGISHKTLKQETVTDILEKDYGVENIPKSIISDALSRLEKKKVIRIINYVLELDEVKIKEIKNNDSKFVELIENIKKDLNFKISQIKNISRSQSEEIINEFFKLLGKMFSSNGRTSSRMISSDRGFLEMFDNNDFKNYYQKQILSKIDTSQHESLNEIFKDFFSNSEKKYDQFFFTMIQSYALLEIFNIDPSLKQIQKNSIKEKKIYLDTNTLIPLLFEEDESYEIIRSIIKVTNELGASLLITNLTKQEFERWLESCRNAYLNFKNIPEKFIEAFKKQNTDAPFFKTYTKKLRDNSFLSINEFCKYYENFLIILKDKYQIELESENLESLKEDENYKTLFDCILNLTPYKGNQVSSHDALNILNVKKQRTQVEGDVIGQSSWFLTTDTSLKKVEKKVFPFDEFPATIRIQIWFQMISPLISPRLAENADASKAFVKLLGINFNSSDIVTEEDILNTLSSFIGDIDITLNSLKRIVGDTHIRETFRKIRQSYRDENYEEQEKWEKIGFAQLSNTLRSEHKSETVDLKKALNNFSNELKLQKSQLEKQNESIKNQQEVLERQATEIKDLQKQKEKQKHAIKYIKNAKKSTLKNLILFPIIYISFLIGGIFIVYPNPSNVELLELQNFVFYPLFILWALLGNYVWKYKKISTAKEYFAIFNYEYIISERAIADIIRKISISITIGLLIVLLMFNSFSTNNSGFSVSEWIIFSISFGMFNIAMFSYLKIYELEKKKHFKLFVASGHCKNCLIYDELKPKNLTLALKWYSSFFKKLKHRGIKQTDKIVMHILASESKRDVLNELSNCFESNDEYSAINKIAKIMDREVEDLFEEESFSQKIKSWLIPLGAMATIGVFAIYIIQLILQSSPKT